MNLSLRLEEYIKVGEIIKHRWTGELFIVLSVKLDVPSVLVYSAEDKRRKLIYGVTCVRDYAVVR